MYCSWIWVSVLRHYSSLKQELLIARCVWTWSERGRLRVVNGPSKTICLAPNFCLAVSPLQRLYAPCSLDLFTVLSRSLEVFFQSTDLFVVVSFYNLNERLTTWTFLPCISLKSLKSRSCNLKSHKCLQLEKKSASLASVSSPPRVFMWWENLLREKSVLGSTSETVLAMETPTVIQAGIQCPA